MREQKAERSNKRAHLALTRTLTPYTLLNSHFVATRKKAPVRISLSAKSASRVARARTCNLGGGKKRDLNDSQPPSQFACCFFYYDMQKHSASAGAARALGAAAALALINWQIITCKRRRRRLLLLPHEIFSRIPGVSRRAPAPFPHFSTTRSLFSSEFRRNTNHAAFSLSC